MISKKIKAIIDDKKLNITELALGAGIPHPAISKILHGKQVNIPNDLIRHLFRDLSVNPMWFYDDMDTKAPMYIEKEKESVEFYKLKEQYSVVLEELTMYQKREIERLKNDKNVHI